MLMKQIYDMSAENVRQFAYGYLRCGVTSRAIQCFERLRWLGKLRQQEYLLLSAMYLLLGRQDAVRKIINRYNKIYI